MLRSYCLRFAANDNVEQRIKIKQFTACKVIVKIYAAECMYELFKQTENPTPLTVLSSSLGRFMGGVPGITPKCDDSVLGAFFAAVESMPRRRMIILFGVGCTPAVSDVVAELLPAAPARIMFPIGRLAFTVAVVIVVVGELMGKRIRRNGVRQLVVDFFLLLLLLLLLYGITSLSGHKT